MTGRAILRILLAGSALAFLASCAEVPTTPTAVAPTPPPSGYWDGDGVPGSPKIIVSISEQHAYFYKGKQLVGESTVSTGKPGFGTPPGHYTVVWKDKEHISTVFGDYVDDFGNVVKSNIDVRKDSKPPGSHYDGAHMPFAMFFRGGYAMHQGYVPPYAASHGCIRLPAGMAEPFFDNAPLGTPVIVKQEAVMHTVTVPPPLPATVPPFPTVSSPAPALVRSTVPASVPPTTVRSTVPVSTPVPVRPTTVRSIVPTPPPGPVRPVARSTVPAPTPIPLRSPSPAPVRSPAPASVRSTAVASPTPAAIRSPSPAPVRPPAPAVRTPGPVLVQPSPTPASKHHRRVHRRSHTRSASPSPTPSSTPPRQ